MRFIEIKGIKNEHRFVNLDRVSLIKLKQNGEIALEPAMEVLVPGDLSYKKVLQILGLPVEKPASGMSQLKEEEKNE